ncbi:MAG TPA: type II secretion system F family protein, partial [Candidatus Sumerlaeota bacterium]|nr:type II secretion system F family protein [Candidatus Sumerlaeota bacterium]
MPIFTYKAKDTKGETIQGSMEADTQAIVINRLQSMGFFPLMVQADLSAKKKTSGLNRIFRARIKNTDLTSFNRQLSDLISAGIPLVKALTIIVNQTANESLREIVATVSSDVQGGDTLAAALSKHPAVFSKLYCAMVKAGETGGMLDAILERLAEFSETEDEIKSKIKSAMAYPAIMLVAGMGAIVILTTVVIPKIMAIFKDLNQALPGITQLLINIIDFFSSYWYMIIGGGIVG